MQGALKIISITVPVIIHICAHLINQLRNLFEGRRNMCGVRDADWDMPKTSRALSYALNSEPIELQNRFWREVKSLFRRVHRNKSLNLIKLQEAIPGLLLSYDF